MNNSPLEMETRALEVFRSLDSELQANTLRYLLYLRDIENRKSAPMVSNDKK
ncbi:MAG: hypothetical protein FWG88_00485 [Oscillospiraceae bacterium]|nr:hypothetical protein [Oscillospiraceae bacterium]